LSEVKQNIRVRFSKRGDIRFTSHHDVMRLFERALRRAELPVAMSEGFNPRLRISLPVPLAVGIAGLNEVADVGLREWMRPEDFRRRLEGELPDGIEILSVQVTATHPHRSPGEVAYRVPLLPGHVLTEEGIRQVLAREELTVERRRPGRVRDVNVRRFIKALRLEEDNLWMLLKWTDRGTARPQEVLEALGCRPGRDYRSGDIERVHVSLSPSR